MSGLEKFSNLYGLYLAGNPIKDFAEIGQLEKLASLDLSNCGLTNMDTLTGLPELLRIDLSHNQIQNVDFFAKIYNLIYS